MFLPLIYPDYTMVRESLFMEQPCVPSLHLSICLFSSSDCRGVYTVSFTGQIFGHQSKQQSCMAAHTSPTVKKQAKKLET